MNDAPQADGGLSVLALGFEVFDDRPDWPVLTIRVDDGDPFAGVAAGWTSFDPGEMLGADSPLLPDDVGRRVAVYRCSCGEAGCGVIAPWIVASPDGRRVSWADPRDYKGVFMGPVEPTSANHAGTVWNLPDLHFDRAQYVAEVERARRDRSWESARRRTARLVSEHLMPLGLEAPPNLPLVRVGTPHGQDGVVLNFIRSIRDPDIRFEQRRLRLTSQDDDPERAAASMVEQLLAVDPVDRAQAFPY
jgi:hypothetical protein